MPVLILTARDAVDDRVRGLDLGADDYMAKPFAMPELAARVRALIRRGQSQAGPRRTHGPLTLDTSARRAWLNDEPIELAAREWAVLEVLLARSEKIVSKEALENNARMLESVLEDFGIKGQIIKVRPGPVVTLYELEPAPGTKTSRVVSLADDIARSMSAVAVRIAVVPGRSVIGIELPNAHRETVYLREQLATEEFERSEAKLIMALGKDIGGNPVCEAQGYRDRAFAAVEGLEVLDGCDREGEEVASEQEDMEAEGKVRRIDDRLWQLRDCTTSATSGPRQLTLEA